MSLLNEVQKYIEAHPGCTSGDIADAFAGYSRQRVLQSASKLRQSGRVAHRCEGDTVTISDDHNFDRQIIIPPIIFNGIAYDDPGSGNNPGGTRYTGYGFEVRKNGVLIASRETKGAIPGSYSAVIDMPSGRGSVTLEFKIFQKGNQGAGNITDCTVIVTKKAASGISIR